MKIEDLKAAEYNPRQITDKRLEMLNKAMYEFGDLSGIVFNRRTGTLIGGHQRVKNLDPEWKIVKHEYQDDTGTVAEGYIETPFGRWGYREVNWPREKELAANVAANKHGGEFEHLKLKEIAVELDAADFDMEIMGFDEDELKELEVIEEDLLSENKINGEDLEEKKKGLRNGIVIIIGWYQAVVLKDHPLFEKFWSFAGTRKNWDTDQKEEVLQRINDVL